MCTNKCTKYTNKHTSYSSLYRSRSTPFGISSDEPSLSPLWLHQAERQMRPFCHLLEHFQWLFKTLNYFLHSYAMTIAWTSQLKCNSSATRSVPFSATSGALSCASLCIWISKFTFRCNSRCIIRWNLSCIIKRISNAFIIFSVCTLTHTFNF